MQRAIAWQALSRAAAKSLKRKQELANDWGPHQADALRWVIMKQYTEASLGGSSSQALKNESSTLRPLP